MSDPDRSGCSLGVLMAGHDVEDAQVFASEKETIRYIYRSALISSQNRKEEILLMLLIFQLQLLYLLLEYKNRLGILTSFDMSQRSQILQLLSACVS